MRFVRAGQQGDLLFNVGVSRAQPGCGTAPGRVPGLFVDEGIAWWRAEIQAPGAKGWPPQRLACRRSRKLLVLSQYVSLPVHKGDAALGVIPAGFRINADAGASYPASTVAAETSAAVAGDIIIAHGNHPEAGTAAGLAEALARLTAQGNTFVRLSDAIPA